MDSVVGRNILSFLLRYNTNVDRISKLEFGPHNINKFAVSPQVDLNTSTLLLELLQCRDGSLTVSNDNGVRQGAIMSPILCCGYAYFDVLLNNLE